jgi:putative oxidoreductase
LKKFSPDKQKFNMNEATLKDIGYFILRFGLGVLIARHGWPKITGGVTTWEHLGQSLSAFGITFFPVFWGFCAAVAEFAGGICVAIGFFFRPACALVLIVMMVVLGRSFLEGNEFNEWAEAAEIAVAFLAMLLMGPGKYSVSVSLKK